MVRKAASQETRISGVSSEYEALKGAKVVSAADGFEVDLLSLWQVRSDATVLCGLFVLSVGSLILCGHDFGLSHTTPEALALVRELQTRCLCHWHCFGNHRAAEQLCPVSCKRNGHLPCGTLLDEALSVQSVPRCWRHAALPAAALDTLLRNCTCSQLTPLWWLWPS